MPELLILRHANAIRYDYEDDFNRRLRTKGKRNAQRIGTWLAVNQSLPDVIYSSPADRALTTAHKAIKSAGYGVDRVKTREDFYPGSCHDFEKLLKKQPKKYQRIMLVGHNPALEMLLQKLVDKKLPLNKKGKILSPASMAILKFDGDWSDLKAGKVKLVDIIHADNLPRQYPYPLLKRRSWRDRPAYYYTQSAVIPYKIVNGKLKILLITSNMGSHWVVPKGIHEPGMTAQESAAKEAMEEAAVKGRVDNRLLASYKYPKWGAKCEVAVYAMRVTKQLCSKQWQESHRKRVWVSVNKAADRLDNPDLQKIIKKLPDWLKKHSL